MYDRAPRIISKPCGSTAPGVGPGTYDSHKNKHKGMYYKVYMCVGIVGELVLAKYY